MCNLAQRHGLDVAAALLMAVVPAMLSADVPTAFGRKSESITTTGAQPDHYYDARKGDAFEYAKIPTVNSIDESFVLVWNLGTRGGEPFVRYQDSTSNGTLSCYDGCQFVYGTTLIDGKVVQTGRIRVTNDPLIYKIMSDAEAGYLSTR
jgi:hypothetical protein